MRHRQPMLPLVKEPLDRRALPGKREQLRNLDWLLRRQELAVAAQQIHKRLGVLESQRPDLDHGRIRTAGVFSQGHADTSRSSRQRNLGRYAAALKKQRRRPATAAASPSDMRSHRGI